MTDKEKQLPKKAAKVLKRTAKAQKRLSKTLRRRHAAELRFRLYGKAAIITASLILCVLLYNIVTPGFSGFLRHEIQLSFVEPDTSISTSTLLARKMNDMVGGEGRADTVAARRLISNGSRFIVQDAFENPVRNYETDVWTPKVWVPLADSADMYLKGKYGDGQGPLSDKQVGWLKDWKERGVIRTSFNTTFFTNGDSREPEQAGFWGSMVGSILTMIVCMLAAFPVGVAAAVYLEEFAPKNRLTDFIEVNINNLAAVPSIIFGLLGLSVYLALFGMPRSAPLVGGLTLGLMTLPVIIITTRVSLKAVPPSMREAARGLGASSVQVVAHHVLPYAMPGIMTGAILGMARAIGETAPLLMIGMIAFIADVPEGFTDPATVMPVQVYLWANSPELGFLEKTSTGIIVLLAILMLMNAAAIYIRKKFEKKW